MSPLKFGLMQRTLGVLINLVGFFLSVVNFQRPAVLVVCQFSALVSASAHLIPIVELTLLLSQSFRERLE